MAKIKQPFIKLLTPKFRASFPNLFKPRAAEDGQKEKFSVVALFHPEEIKKNPKDLELWNAILASVKPQAKALFGDALPKDIKNPFRQGTEEGKEKYEGYGEGVVFLSLTAIKRPGLVDQRRQAIINEEDIYPGVWLRAQINPYAWEYMGKKGVSFGLLSIQKVADDEPFGGKRDAADDFDAISEVGGETANADDLFA